MYIVTVTEPDGPCRSGSPVGRAAGACQIRTDESCAAVMNVWPSALTATDCTQLLCRKGWLMGCPVSRFQSRAVRSEQPTRTNRPPGHVASRISPSCLSGDFSIAPEFASHAYVMLQLS